MARAYFILAAVAVVGVAALLARRQVQQPQDWQGYAPQDFWPDVLPQWGEQTPEWEPDQTTTWAEDFAVAVDPRTYLAPSVAPDVAAANVRAFLDMIAWAEGTSGPDGYRMLFGGALFDSYDEHPRVFVPFRNTTSSAAGRYQILWRTWNTLRQRLGLPDFSPASQDAAAIELIRERGALRDVQAGRVAEAVRKVAKVWASLPGAGYDQPERKLSALVQRFAAAGGTLEDAA